MNPHEEPERANQRLTSESVVESSPADTKEVSPSEVSQGPLVAHIASSNDDLPQKALNVARWVHQKVADGEIGPVGRNESRDPQNEQTPHRGVGC